MKDTKQHNTLSEMETTKENIESLIERIIGETGSYDAEDVNQGECTCFAKAFVDQFGGIIIDGLTEEAMRDELNGYDTREIEIDVPCDPTYRQPISHCFVEVDGRYYDAETPEGVEFESELPIYNR